MSIVKNIVLVLFLLFLDVPIRGQVIYTSPVNNSKYNMPETNIIIRFVSGIIDDNLLDCFDLKNQKGISLLFSYVLAP